MVEEGTASAYLSKVLERLEGEGYDCARGVSHGERTFSAVAKRAKFELAKFGVVETFFVFAEFPSLDAAGLKEYSAGCYEYAVAAKLSPLPRGVLKSVFCYAVALVSRVDDALAEMVKNEAPPKHMSSVEIPVLFDQAAQSLSYFEKTQIWGAAYFRGIRKTVQEMLAP